MDRELRTIVETLARQRSYMTSDELALATGITPRRVRSVVSAASATLSRAGVRIDAAPRKGYVLVGSSDAIARLLDERDSETSRLQEVLEILLMADDYVKLDDLADELYVSRSTMNRLMRDAREVLARHGLTLRVRPYHGLRVEGSEYARRLCAAECCEVGERREPGIPALLLRRPEDAERVRRIEEVLRTSLAGQPIELSDFGFYNLVVHLYIALLRVERGEYVSVPMEVEASEGERRVAEKIARAVSERFGVELPDVEISYVVIHLRGKRMLDASDAPMITAEAEGLVRAMNERVYERLGIDVRGDLELFTALGLHLVPCLSRLRFGLRVSNPLLDDIKQNMREGFECALAASSVIAERCGAALPEEEMGYFALHYALACERLQHRRPLRVLLCCATGVGTVRYLRRKIERAYDVDVSQIVTASVHDLASLDLASFDVALSTVPVPRPFAGKVTYLENIFTDELPQLDAVPSADDAGCAFLAEKDVLACDGVTREEAIARLCALVRDEALAPGELAESVLSREHASSTAIGNMVAIPHPERLLTERSHVRAMVLARAIDWGGKPVRVVFLTALSRSDRAEGEAINDALLDFATDADRVLEFLRNPTPERLVRAL